MSDAAEKSEKTTPQQAQTQAKAQASTNGEVEVISKRSPLRCHLISRTPFYTQEGNASMYELKFTKGNVFMLDALESDHIYHILVGFFIRRSIDNFIGKNSVAAIKLPIDNMLLEQARFYQTSRLCVIIPNDQEPTATVLHQISMLNRLNTKFAIDIDLLMTTAYHDVIHAIDYVFVNSQRNLTEQILLFSTLKEENVKIKLVATNVDNQAQADNCFAMGADLVLTKYYEAEYKAHDEVTVAQEHELNNDMIVMLNEIFKAEPDFKLLGDIIGKYAFMVGNILNIINITNPRLVGLISTMSHAVTYLGKEQMKNFVCICCAYALRRNQFLEEEYRTHKPTYESLKYALVRARFVENIANIRGNKIEKTLAFQTGLFSMMNSEVNDNSDTTEIKKQIKKLYLDSLKQSESLLSQALVCMGAIEDQNLATVLASTRNMGVSINVVLSSYEDSLIWSNNMVSAI